MFLSKGVAEAAFEPPLKVYSKTVKIEDKTVRYADLYNKKNFVKYELHVKIDVWNRDTENIISIF